MSKGFVLSIQALLLLALGFVLGMDIEHHMRPIVIIWVSLCLAIVFVSFIVTFVREAL